MTRQEYNDKIGHAQSPEIKEKIWLEYISSLESENKALKERYAHYKDATSTSIRMELMQELHATLTVHHALEALPFVVELTENSCDSFEHLLVKKNEAITLLNYLLKRSDTYNAETKRDIAQVKTETKKLIKIIQDAINLPKGVEPKDWAEYKEAFLRDEIVFAHCIVECPKCRHLYFKDEDCCPKCLGEIK